MTDFEKVIDFENMYRAYRRSKRGKGYKQSAAKFGSMTLDGIHTLIEQLKRREYRIAPYHEFMVYEPKERLIQTTSFKDKVVQHSLCDNVLLPRMEGIFIAENSAGQKGKGTLYALDLLERQMKQFHRKYNRTGYFLKCDISKFFYHISHEQLKDIVEYHFSYDPDICWLCKLFIDSTDGKGIPLGSQINQGFALLYLDGMDKLITGALGVEFYGRFMDDFYLIHPSKQYLQYCLENIKVFLQTLDLTLNDKTQICLLKNGLSFLGFHSYITEDGKVIRRVDNQNKRNARKKYRRMAKKVVAGELPKEKLDRSYAAYKNHLSHGNCRKVSTGMDRMIQHVLEEKPDETTML